MVPTLLGVPGNLKMRARLSPAPLVMLVLRHRTKMVMRTRKEGTPRLLSSFKPARARAPAKMFWRPSTHRNTSGVGQPAPGDRWPLSSSSCGRRRSQAGTDPEAGPGRICVPAETHCRCPCTMPAHGGSNRRWARAGGKPIFLSAARPPQAAGPKEGRRASSSHSLRGEVGTSVFPTPLADAPAASTPDARASGQRQPRAPEAFTRPDPRRGSPTTKLRRRRRRLRPPPDSPRVCGQSWRL